MEPPAPDVYGIFGHACDILTGRESDNIPVPPGIVYVTIAICGLVSIELLKLMYAFEDTSIWPALRDPVNNAEMLRQYFEDRTFMETNLQIHRHGDTYVDSWNTLFYNGSTNIFKSGIYRLGEFQPVRSDVDYGASNAAGGNRVSVSQPFMEAEIRAAYNGSRIQPMVYGPFRTIDEFKAANNLGAQVSTLFHSMRASDASRPFVFYNFACRTVCGGDNAAIQGLSLARRAKNLSAGMLRNRMHVLDVHAQVAAAGAAADTAQASIAAWVARKRASEAARRTHFSAAAAAAAAFASRRLLAASQSALRRQKRHNLYRSLRAKAKSVSKGKSVSKRGVKWASRSTRVKRAP